MLQLAAGMRLFFPLLRAMFVLLLCSVLCLCCCSSDERAVRVHFQLLPRQGPLHSLKGKVPEAAAHVSAMRCAARGGGSSAQRRASTAVSGRRRWQLACDFTMLAAELASDFDSLCSSWQLASDFSSLRCLLCLCCCYVQCYVCA